RGSLGEALAQYRTALTLARNDPDLEQTVNELTRQLAPKKGPQPVDGLSFEQVRQELLTHAPKPDAGASSTAAPPPAVAAPQPPAPPVAATDSTDHQSPAQKTIVALEQWLDALDAARADRRP